VYCCTTPAEQQYVEQFQTATLALFQQLPSSAVIFSSACLVHVSPAARRAPRCRRGAYLAPTPPPARLQCRSSHDDFFQFTVNNVSLQTAVAGWFFDNAPMNVIADCTGWACTLQCSGGPWEPTNTPCASTTNVCANTYMYTAPPAPLGMGTSAVTAAPMPTAPATPVQVAAQAVQAALAAAPAAAQAAAAQPQAAPTVTMATPAATVADGQAEKAFSSLAPQAAPVQRLSARSFTTTHLVLLASLVLLSVTCGAFCNHYCRRARRRMKRGGDGATESTQLL